MVVWLEIVIYFSHIMLSEIVKCDIEHPVISGNNIDVIRCARMILYLDQKIVFLGGRIQGWESWALSHLIIFRFL